MPGIAIIYGGIPLSECDTTNDGKLPGADATACGAIFFL